MLRVLAAATVSVLFHQIRLNGVAVGGHYRSALCIIAGVRRAGHGGGLGDRMEGASGRLVYALSLHMRAFGSVCPRDAVGLPRHLLCR